jgi:transcriptional regulator with XRE-family HTH domain
MDTAEVKRLSEQLGANVRAERARRNLRQEDVAHAAGLAIAQYARIERGESGDSGVSKYVRIARALGVNIAELFRDVE